MTTWPRPDSPWSPGRLDVMLLILTLVLLILCQHARPRPVRYTPPSHKACLLNFGYCP